MENGSALILVPVIVSAAHARVNFNTYVHAKHFIHTRGHTHTCTHERTHTHGDTNSHLRTKPTYKTFAIIINNTISTTLC